MRELHLFAGAGGGILGGMLLGHTPVAAVEIEPYCQNVLRARQRDGILPEFPIFGDIRAFDGTKWRGAVDIVCGGFPCQDISAAGKGAGISGARSGLWSEMARVIGEVRPRFAFIENSPLLRTRGLGTVLQDLAKMGYDARWGVLGAWHVGAPHKRDRMWVLAHTNTPGLEGDKCTGRVDTERREKSSRPATECRGLPGASWWHQDPAEVGNTLPGRLPLTEPESCEKRTEEGASERARAASTSRWPTEPRLGRVAYGVAHRVDRLKAIGNGQVPAVAATAFRILSQGLI